MVNKRTLTLNRLRQSKHTGQNRCVPCTVVNVMLVFGMCGVLTVLSPFVGVVGLILGLGMIYLRGYLIPGTPTLTDRYLPGWVLRRFEHDSRSLAGNDIDMILQGGYSVSGPADILRSADVIKPCYSGTDLCLTGEFATTWQQEIGSFRSTDYLEALSNWLDQDPTALSIEQGESIRVVNEDRQIAKWESEAAMLADLAAVPVLRSRQLEWEKMSISTQAQLLYALRIFIERCPVCESELVFSRNAVRSCCRSSEDVLLSCECCEARILETRV